MIPCQCCASIWTVEWAKRLHRDFFVVLKGKSRRGENVAPSVAFFPSSGIHWGFGWAFFTFPLLLGVARLPCLCALSISCLSAVQALRTATHPQFHTLNIAYHTGTTCLPTVSETDPSNPRRSFYPRIIRSDQLWTQVQAEAHKWVPVWDISARAQLELIVFDQH